VLQRHAASQYTLVAQLGSVVQACVCCTDRCYSELVLGNADVVVDYSRTLDAFMVRADAMPAPGRLGARGGAHHSRRVLAQAADSSRCSSAQLVPSVVFGSDLFGMALAAHNAALALRINVAIIELLRTEVRIVPSHVLCRTARACACGLSTGRCDAFPPTARARGCRMHDRTAHASIRSAGVQAART
jgi:hypothetical protein